ncbi:MAG: LPXTG cell wall anchor domain-containing protein [Candidatus Limivicinus sp.]
MSKTKPKVRRQMLILFCALLLFGQIFAAAAYADREQNVNISYTVTEDMLPKPVPTATPKPTASPAPTATPHPGKGEPPKTGDESMILVYGLLAASSALAALGLFVYLNKKEEEEFKHE